MAFDWKGTIGQVAPALAGILGTPAAGAAVAGLCGILGLEPSQENAQKVAEQVAAGSLTGDQLLQLRKVESDSIAQLRKMGMDYDLAKETLVFTDREGARKREVDAKDSWTPRILAGLIVFGFLWAVYYVLSGRVGALKDPASIGMIGTLIGYVSAKTDTVYGYYFGGSAGEKQKTDLLYNSTPTDGAAK